VRTRRRAPVAKWLKLSHENERSVGWGCTLGAGFAKRLATTKRRSMFSERNNNSSSTIAGRLCLSRAAPPAGSARGVVSTMFLSIAVLCGAGQVPRAKEDHIDDRRSKRSALGAAGDRGVGLWACVLNTMATMPPLRAGDEEQKRRFLPGIADGSVRFAFAITEPDAGISSFAIRTLARRAGDSYRLDGSKGWITGADVADYIVVVARTMSLDELKANGLAKTHGMGLFIVDANAAGRCWRAVRGAQPTRRAYAWSVTLLLRAHGEPFSAGVEPARAARTGPGTEGHDHGRGLHRVARSRRAARDWHHPQVGPHRGPRGSFASRGRIAL